MPPPGDDEVEESLIQMRSYLFVPADSERKLEKAPASGADCLIVDLEDSVSVSRKPVARKMAAEFLSLRSGAAGP